MQNVYCHGNNYGYDEIDTISDVDSNDPNVKFYDDYKIKLNIRRIFPQSMLTLRVKCFRKIVFMTLKHSMRINEVTGNEGVQCSKFYQCAAIMVYRPPDDLIPILVRGDAKPSKIEKIFLNEFEKRKANISD